MERDVARESKVNQEQQTAIDESALRVSESSQKIEQIELEIKANRDDLAQLQALRETHVVLKEEHELLRERFDALVRRSDEDREMLEQLQIQIDALRSTRAAQREQLKRIERILGIDPDT